MSCQVDPLKFTVEVCESVEHLASLCSDWCRLDGDVPFCSFDWLATWWKHYGQPAGQQRRSLYVLVVRIDTPTGAARVVALAPWYAERTRTRGTVLRQLGGGEVCSDHVGILCHAEFQEAAAGAIANHLSQNNTWDRLELDSIDAGDAVVEHLASQLADLRCETRCQPAGNCWVIDLPESWDAFLAMQSKSHRKQLRRADDRLLQSDRVRWHLATDEAEFERSWPILVDLHQRRRKSLGEPGCFASPAFAAFHREAATKLLAAGHLRLSWLELDGSPVAAEYQLAGAHATYAYQGGVDPVRLDDGPGQLSIMATLKTAIANGHRTYDFLRGDEPYKAHWRATPRPTFNLRVLAPSHHTNWLAQTADWADSMASALKAGLRPLVSPVSQAL